VVVIDNKKKKRSEKIQTLTHRYNSKREFEALKIK
jgi:hypothetical protein